MNRLFVLIALAASLCAAGPVCIVAGSTKNPTLNMDFYDMGEEFLETAAKRLASKPELKGLLRLVPSVEDSCRLYFEAIPGIRKTQNQYRIDVVFALANQAIMTDPNRSRAEAGNDGLYWSLPMSASFTKAAIKSAAEREADRMAPLLSARLKEMK